MGDLGFMLKLFNWWQRFIGILKGTVALPSPIVDEYAIQIALIAHGYPVWITGQLDPQTRDALAKFQSNNGLEADGKFGPKTQKALGL